MSFSLVFRKKGVQYPKVMIILGRGQVKLTNDHKIVPYEQYDVPLPNHFWKRDERDHRVNFCPLIYNHKNKMDDVSKLGQNQCHSTKVKESYFSHTFHLRPKKFSGLLVGWMLEKWLRYHSVSIFEIFHPIPLNIPDSEQKPCLK